MNENDDDVDDQFPETNVVRGASTKGSNCSAAPAQEVNEILDHSAHEITTLYLLVTESDDPISLPLEHCPTVDLFYSAPSDIQDFLSGNNWLDVGILQVWCT